MKRKEQVGGEGRRWEDALGTARPAGDRDVCAVLGAAGETESPAYSKGNTQR